MKEKRIRDKQMIVCFTERELSEFSEKMKRAKSKSRSDFIISLVRNKPIIVGNCYTSDTDYFGTDTCCHIY